MTLRNTWAMVLAGTAAVACSSQQTYATGQAWQRNGCQKIVDMQERERCLAPTREPYESYQRKADALKKPAATE